MSTEVITFADVAEQVRALLAALAQAQDDGRTEDMVALYAEDGIVDGPGWAVATVARYHDTFRNDGGTWVLAPAVDGVHRVTGCAPVTQI